MRLGLKGQREVGLGHKVLRPNRGNSLEREKELEKKGTGF